MGIAGAGEVRERETEGGGVREKGTMDSSGFHDPLERDVGSLSLPPVGGREHRGRVFWRVVFLSFPLVSSSRTIVSAAAATPSSSLVTSVGGGEIGLELSGEFSGGESCRSWF